MSITQAHRDAAKGVQEAMSRAAIPAVKARNEEELKWTMPFRGLQLSKVKKLSARWFSSLRPTLRPLDIKAIGTILLESRYFEDKVVGISVLRFVPSDQLGGLAFAEAIFSTNNVWDPATADWTGIALLSTLIKGNGERAQELAKWAAQVDENDAQLLRRRACCMAFIALAKHGNAAPNSPAFVDTAVRVAVDLMHVHPTETLKRAAGRLLEVLAKADDEATKRALAAHQPKGKQAPRMAVPQLRERMI